MREAKLAGGIMGPSLGGQEIHRKDAFVEDQPSEELGFWFSKSPPDFGWLKSGVGAIELSRVGRRGGVAAIRRPQPSNGVSPIRHEVGVLDDGGQV